MGGREGCAKYREEYIEDFYNIDTAEQVKSMLRSICWLVGEGNDEDGG